MAESTLKTIATNRRAFHDYAFEEKFECGIELVGSEVKSVRAAEIAFADSYARLRDGELWLVGFRISPYHQASIFNHDPDRERRLLVHRAEIRKLRRRVEERGYTLIPLRIYLREGLVKIELGLGKGKRAFDKRETIKRRDQRADSDREMRDRFR